jgi:hypothetical protein
VEQVDAIIDIEALENDGEVFAKLDKFFARFQNCTTQNFTHIVFM